MTTIQKKRPRRIASDEAHAWARNLRLNNTTAKFILMMIAGYVDGDGVCFVSLAALAEDTELSTQTIRSRLAWLEEVGVIARSAQWVDEYGRRNGEGKGRRTSDNIRLMIDLDQDSVERRARKDDGGPSNVTSEVDPQNLTESGFDPQNSVDHQAQAAPPVAPHADPHVDPQNSVEGLISEPEPEPEPESLPKPLSEGLSAREESQEVQELREPEHFAEFWWDYPGHEVMSRYRSLEIFATMSPKDREHARAAAPHLAKTLEKMKRRPRDAHKWLAEKGWMEYPQAKIAKSSSAPSRRMIQAEELIAVNCALRLASQRELSVISVYNEEQGTKYVDAAFWGREIGPDLLALVPFAAIDDDALEFVEVDTPNFYRWRDRLKQWLGFDPSTVKKWLEPYNPAVHGLPGSDPNFKPRKCVIGLRVPKLWPPRLDGTWGRPERGELSDQDAADFTA